MLMRHLSSLFLVLFLELDKCADNPCRFGGVCQNSGLNCTCAQGFQGPKCSSGRKYYKNVVQTFS